jgi:hypothetical protein
MVGLGDPESGTHLAGGSPRRARDPQLRDRGSTAVGTGSNSSLDFSRQHELTTRLKNELYHTPVGVSRSPIVRGQTSIPITRPP